MHQVANLVDHDEIDKAADIIVREEDFFKDHYGDAEVKALLDRFTVALEASERADFAVIEEAINAVSWPQPPGEWDAVRARIAAIQADLESSLDKDIYAYELYRPQRHKELEAELEHVRESIRQQAATAFAIYPLFSGTDFFKVYPVEVDPERVMAESHDDWTARLSRSDEAQVTAFMARYGTYMPLSARERYAKRFFLTLCPDPGNASLQEIITAYEKCTLAGLPLKRIPGIKIGFLQVTSPTLIKEKAIDFAVNVKVDVPFQAKRASMRKMFSHKVVKDADIVVLMNVAVSKARRVVEKRVKLKSFYAASYVRQANPEYDIIKTELQSASSQFHAAQSSGGAPWPLSVVGKVFGGGKEAKVEDTGERLTTLQEKLRTTPQTISVPDYQPYDVIKAHMDIHKYATVNYYILDKRTKTFFQDTIDVRDKSFFTVCYDLHETDRNREKFLQTSVLEEDVVRHELEPVVVNLSDMLAQYMGSPQAKTRYSSMESVHRAIVRDRNMAQRTHRNETFGYERGHDKRFDSVVVVRNLGTGIGAGFYVTDNLILTNYHVVEENEYVRLRMFDEREMLGRVIARDMHLDLALIQADIRQRPVCFYDKRNLPLGATLEAIGHPVRFRYAITRGVLSMIRHHKPVLYKQQTKRKVLYIQTDAALNGGNSGGPLFYGDYVVGVNDWGIDVYGGKKKRVADGIGFAIHYSEVFTFLERHGVDVCKGSR